MAHDVLCLRPCADFTDAGVTPPEALDVAYRAPGDPDVLALAREARAMMIPAAGPPLPPDLFCGTRLELVQVTGAGVDRVDRNVLAAEGIALANVPGGSNAALAEYVVANVLSLTRGFAAATAALRAGRYAEFRAATIAAGPSGLGGLTVGIVGVGTIGIAVAEHCHDMGAGIAFHDPTPLDAAALDRLGADAMGIDALLGAADVISLHVPLTDSTRGLIDARRLQLMKPGAILVNAARGGIVDEPALVAALETGHLGGAVVDVYATEPPPPDHPLLTLSQDAAARLILTPHIAGVSRQAWAYLFAVAWRNVTRVLLDGAPPENVVA